MDHSVVVVVIVSCASGVKVLTSAIALVNKKTYWVGVVIMKYIFRGADAAAELFSESGVLPSLSPLITISQQLQQHLTQLLVCTSSLSLSVSASLSEHHDRLVHNESNVMYSFVLAQIVHWFQRLDSRNRDGVLEDSHWPWGHPRTKICRLGLEQPWTHPCSEMASIMPSTRKTFFHPLSTPKARRITSHLAFWWKSYNMERMQ